MQVDGENVLLERESDIRPRGEQFLLRAEVVDEVGDRVEVRREDRKRALVEDMDEPLAEVAERKREVSVAAKGDSDAVDATNILRRVWQGVRSVFLPDVRVLVGLDEPLGAVYLVDGFIDGRPHPPLRRGQHHPRASSAVLPSR